MARAAWLTAFVAYFTLWGLGSYQRVFGPAPDCRAVLCDNIEFSAADVRVLEGLHLPGFVNAQVWRALEVPYSLLFFVIAGLIFWRRPDHVVGLLLSLCLVYLGSMLFSGSDDALRRSYPQLQPLVSGFDGLGIISLLLVLLTFPDGRILSKPVAVVSAGILFLLLAIALLAGGSSRLQGPTVPPLATALWLMLFIIMIAIGLQSQVSRYRSVSSSVQRQQTKWVVLGLAGYVLVVFLWGTIGYAYPPTEPSPERVRLVLLATPVILLLSALVPMSVAFAILRYRLFDIDRLIHRALVYTILSGMLALTYAAGVVLLQALTSALGLGGTSLALVVSTLLIAGLFSPLRGRVQLFIDRRFYRQRYDAEQTLKIFSSHMREAAAVDSLADELLSVTYSALHPEHVALWIKDSGEEVRIGSRGSSLQDSDA